VRHPQPVDAVEACVPNIGPRGRRARLLGGAAALLLGAGATAALVVRGVAPTWHLTLLPVFACAALGYFQAREKT